MAITAAVTINPLTRVLPPERRRRERGDFITGSLSMSNGSADISGLGTGGGGATLATGREAETGLGAAAGAEDLTRAWMTIPQCLHLNACPNQSAGMRKVCLHPGQVACTTSDIPFTSPA